MNLLKRSLLEQQLFVKRLIEETRGKAAVSEPGTKNDEVFLEASQNNAVKKGNIDHVSC